MTKPDGHIRIEYGVIECEREPRYVPTIWIYDESVEHGKPRMSTVFISLHSKACATEIAYRNAREEAKHYVGDWTITLTPREPLPTLTTV